jgi:hypothetical protein
VHSWRVAMAVQHDVADAIERLGRHARCHLPSCRHPHGFGAGPR